MAKRAEGFEVQLTLGNSAMLTGADIARELRKIADEIQHVKNPRPMHGGTVRDVNGNRVGHFEIKDEV